MESQKISVVQQDLQDFYPTFRLLPQDDGEASTFLGLQLDDLGHFYVIPKAKPPLKDKLHSIVEDPLLSTSIYELPDIALKDVIHLCDLPCLVNLAFSARFMFMAAAEQLKAEKFNDELEREVESMVQDYWESVAEGCLPIPSELGGESDGDFPASLDFYPAEDFSTTDQSGWDSDGHYVPVEFVKERRQEYRQWLRNLRERRR